MDAGKGPLIIENEGDIGIYTAVRAYIVRRDWLRDNRETGGCASYKRCLMRYDVL